MKRLKQLYNKYIYNNRSLKRSIIFTHQSSKRKKWDKVYIAVDIHDTIVHANYDTSEIPKDFISNAKEVLQYLTKRNDIGLILYTCSHKSEITKYLEYFSESNIEFEYVNKNPAISNTELGCYDTKLYFNILLDDKAGFDAKRDWNIVYRYIKKLNFDFSK